LSFRCIKWHRSGLGSLVYPLNISMSTLHRHCRM
jgi:hypothetical protein